jgi:hypothetical protein
MQQSGNQGGLAAVRMPHYSYVADLTSLVRFHGVLLVNAGRFWAPTRRVTVTSGFEGETRRMRCSVDVILKMEEDRRSAEP